MKFPRAEAEAAVIRDYDAIKGRDIQPTDVVVCYDDATQTQIDLYPQAVVLRITGPDRSEQGLLRWTAGDWIDPIYDVELVSDPNGEIPEGVRVLYVHSRSYGTTGAISPAPFAVVGLDTEVPSGWAVVHPSVAWPPRGAATTRVAVSIQTEMDIEAPEFDRTAILQGFKEQYPDASIEVLPLAEIVVTADPDDVADYAERLEQFEAAKRDRNFKILAGVHPDELPTEEQLRDDIVGNEEPELWPRCSNCGATSFQYSESTWTTESTEDIVDNEDGTFSIRFHGGGRGGEGDGWPGLRCGPCESRLTEPDNVDHEWGC